METDINQTEPLEAHFAPEVLVIVKRAAELEGCSVNDFIVAAANAAAVRVVEKSEIIRLSVEDQRRFADALLNPPAPNNSLRRAAEAYRTLVTPLGL